MRRSEVGSQPTVAFDSLGLSWAKSTAIGLSVKLAKDPSNLRRGSSVVGLGLGPGVAQRSDENSGWEWPHRV